MNKKKEGTRFDLLALAEYEKIAEISYVQVSDGSEIRILQSSAKSDKKDPYTLVLIAGWSSLVLGWDPVLMESKDIFNIVYIETREKGSSKITKKAKFDFERFALDVKEVIEYLELDQSNMVMLTTSFSSMIIAYLMKNKLINPLLSIFIG
ncbi:MAG: alpha/beta fold hydrolase, partial [Candidatus Heimdallarchaeaceae archaeon]